MSQNKRKHERFDAQIDVQFGTGREFIQAYSQNISKGGMFLEAEKLPDPNAVVELVLDLHPLFPEEKAEETKIRLRARVVRLVTVVENDRTVNRIAVQFLDLPGPIQKKLDDLAKRAG